jgi:hypothetical protein
MKKKKNTLNIKNNEKKFFLNKSTKILEAKNVTNVKTDTKGTEPLSEHSCG